MKQLLTILLIVLYSCGGAQGDCGLITSKQFKSYNEAIKEVRKSSFQLTDKIKTPESSWIASAEYYSCDGNEGYFIMNTGDKSYIHKEVPVEVWEGFKAAGSKGSYYNEHLKGQYRVYLKQY